MRNIVVEGQPVELGEPPDVDDLGPAVIIDAETHRIRHEEGMVAPRSVCWAWLDIRPDGTLGRRGVIARDDFGPFLGELLRSGRVWGNFNTAYDAVVACADFPSVMPEVIRAYDENRIRCFQVRQKLIDVVNDETKARRTRGRWVKNKLHSLATVADHWLGVTMEGKGEDAWRMRYGELDGVPVEEWPEDAIVYPVLDVVRAAQCGQAQMAWARERNLSTDGRMPDEARQVRADLMLQLISTWGVRTDPTAVEALSKAVGDELKLCERLIAPVGIYRDDGSRNMKALRERVVAACARLGVSPATTATGEISTETDYLKEIAGGDDEIRCAMCNGRGGEIRADGERVTDCIACAGVGRIRPLEIYAKASHARTIQSREVKILRRGAVAPVCANYDVLKATGRTSASQPNVQNPSRQGGVRECYIPRPGWLFSDVDYEAIELRALAQVCLDLVGWSSLAEAFRRGMDPHLLFAAQLLGISYDEAVRRRREPVVKQMRQLAKVANFGFPGGLSAESFVEYAWGYDERLKTVVDLAMAHRLRDGWFTTWAEMGAYFSRVKSIVGDHGGGTIVQLRSGRIRGNVRFTQGANGFFQGLTADGCKDAGWDLMLECYLGRWTSPPANDAERALHAAGAPSPLFGSRPVIFLHDQFVLEVPAHDARAASRAADRHAHVQVVGMSRWMPDVPVIAGPALTRRWWKGAEGVRVDGLLVPCKPAKVDGEERWVPDLIAA